MLSLVISFLQPTAPRFVQVSFLTQFEKCFAALFEFIAGIFCASGFLQQLSNCQGCTGLSALRIRANWDLFSLV
jgi:hypothetical protein